MPVSNILAIVNCSLTVVVFFSFGLDLVPESSCILLSSVGCEMESHSSDICDGRCEGSAAGEVGLEVVAKS